MNDKMFYENISKQMQEDKEKIKQLEEENKRLKEKLECSQTNEETYRLEMEDITKMLGLKENELFDDVKKYANNLHQENEQLKTLLDTILNFNFFKEECPLNFGFENKSNEDKAQEVFFEDEWCEKNCDNNYKKCWLKYFEKLIELEKGDSNEVHK